MFKDANVTVMVSDMEKAVEFYTKTLGLKLTYRMGDDWAEIEAPRLNIGLHKAGEQGVQPGQKGSLSIGFQVESLDDAISRLKGVGVEFAPHRVDDRGGPQSLDSFRPNLRWTPRALTPPVPAGCSPA